MKLYDCYVKGDCDLAEINPLVLTTDGRVHALDAKVTLDDNAAYPPSRMGRVRRDGGASTSASGWRTRRASTTSAFRATSASSPTVQV